MVTALASPVTTRLRPGLPSYVYAFLAALVANMFAGNWGLLGVPLPLDRGLLFLGLVLLALDRRPWSRAGIRWGWTHLLLALLVALAGFSALWHRTLLTSYGLYALSDRLIVPFLLLVLGGIIFRADAERTLLLRTLTLMGLYLGLTALFEALGIGALVFPHFITDPDVGIQFGRARGPFLASEAMGIALCQCGFAAAVLLRGARGAWRAVAVVVLALAALGVLLTLTRSVWVGAGAGVLLVFLLDRRLWRWLPAVLVGTAVAVAVALAVVPGLSTAVDDRLGTERSIDDRRNTNEAALRIVERAPLTGVGWMRFVEVNDSYVRQADDYPITNTAIEVHNVTLSRAAELGLPGALLWVLCVGAGPVRGALRRPRGRGTGGDGWRVLCIGSTCCWLAATVFSPVPYPLANSLTFLIAGIALTPVLTRERSAARPGAAR